jgi:hypothetical protein
VRKGLGIEDLGDLVDIVVLEPGHLRAWDFSDTAI